MYILCIMYIINKSIHIYIYTVQCFIDFNFCTIVIQLKIFMALSAIAIVYLSYM